MPKVSAQHREARRQQVLDGARRCFARHGLQGTTVRALERETGLSSGAIFNHFPTKLDLFVALAEQDNLRAAELWRRGGLPAVVEAFSEGREELTGSYLELGRRIWSDPGFRATWAARGKALEEAIGASIAEGQRAGRYRGDLPPEALADFAAIFLDGLLLRLRIDGLPSDRQPLYDLYEQALSAGDERDPREAP